MSDRLRKKDWEVRETPIWIATEIIRKYHYAKSAGHVAIAIHGLYKKEEGWFGQRCYGATWWQPGMFRAAQKYWSDMNQVLVLSRLVIIPEVPKNAATFLLMNSVKQLDHRWKCLLTYADTWQGHTGHI